MPPGLRSTVPQRIFLHLFAADEVALKKSCQGAIGQEADELRECWSYLRPEGTGSPCMISRIGSCATVPGPTNYRRVQQGHPQKECREAR